MHFCICMWGLMRSLPYTINSFQENIINPILYFGHTYEIIVHTYKFSGEYKNPRNHEISTKLNFSEWRLLKPDHIKVEDQDEFDRNHNYLKYTKMGDPWKNNYSSFKNHLRALNSLNYLSNVLLEKSKKKKKIDGVIFLRPDTKFVNEIPIYLFEFYKNTLFVPDFHRSCHGGEYNDRMAMGDLKSAIIYGKKFEFAFNYSLAKPLHSEKLTYDYLKYKEVNVLEIPFRMQRTRSQGEIHVRDHEAVHPKIQNKYSAWNPHYEYETPFYLRVFYSFLEFITFYSVYFWNHDDDGNVYCTPNPKITFNQCIIYKKKAEKVRRKNFNYFQQKTENLVNSENFVEFRKILSNEVNNNKNVEDKRLMESSDNNEIYPNNDDYIGDKRKHIWEEKGFFDNFQKRKMRKKVKKIRKKKIYISMRKQDMGFKK